MHRLLILFAVVSILAMTAAERKEQNRKLWVLEFFQPSNTKSVDTESKSLRGSEKVKPVILDKDDTTFDKKVTKKIVSKDEDEEEPVKKKKGFEESRRR